MPSWYVAASGCHRRRRRGRHCETGSGLLPWQVRNRVAYCRRVTWRGSRMSGERLERFVVVNWAGRCNVASPGGWKQLDCVRSLVTPGLGKATRRQLNKRRTVKAPETYNERACKLPATSKSTSGSRRTYEMRCDAMQWQGKNAATWVKSSASQAAGGGGGGPLLLRYQSPLSLYSGVYSGCAYWLRRSIGSRIRNRHSDGQYQPTGPYSINTSILYLSLSDAMIVHA